MPVIFITTREKSFKATDVDIAALCEIEFDPSATLTLADSFSARCAIQFDASARVTYEPIVCAIQFNASANISIDGSADTHLTALCEIEFDASADLVERVHLFARCLIEFDAFANAHIRESDSYQIQIIVDVVDDWGDPFSD